MINKAIIDSTQTVLYLEYSGFVPRNAFDGVAKNTGVINAQTSDSTSNWMTDNNPHFITNNTHTPA